MESANNWCLCRVKSEMNEVFLPKSRGESFKFQKKINGQHFEAH